VTWSVVVFCAFWGVSTQFLDPFGSEQHDFPVLQHCLSPLNGGIKAMVWWEEDDARGFEYRMKNDPKYKDRFLRSAQERKKVR